MNKELPTMSPHVATILPEGLLDELRHMIDQTRRFIASTVNSALTIAFWKVGDRIRKETLQKGRAGYGQEIVVTLSRQLSWSHFVAILPIKDPIKRDFYAEMCRLEKWNVRTLRAKIDSMLFERTALSKKPDE